MKNIAIIIAGGTGQRMKSCIPKQFINIYDKPAIIYTLEKFQNHEMIDIIEVVCLDGWQHVLSAYANEHKITKLKHIVKGGTNGQESIKNGILELKKYYNNDDLVVIHDAIRPNVSKEIITNAINVAKEKSNAITVVACKEAMMETEDSISSSSSYPRDKLKRTQTPQVFFLGDILDAHNIAAELGITDAIASCDLFTRLGRQIYFTEGSEKNIKLTTSEDLDIFKALLKLENEK